MKHAILTALADDEMQRILDSAMQTSKSVIEIIKDKNIPHTNAYRKIKWLVDEGLLSTDKIYVTDEGKKFSLFRSVLKSVHITYVLDELTIDTEKNVDIIGKIAEKFFSLD